MCGGGHVGCGAVGCGWPCGVVGCAVVAMWDGGMCGVALFLIRLVGSG